MRAFKLVVLGDFGVGKTSLIRRYVLDEFTGNYRATLGVHLYKHSDRIAAPDGEQPVDMVLWDIEGAPLPNAQTRRYVTGASAALIVGDVSREEPLPAMENAAEMFLDLLPGRPLALAFNKSDLVAERGTEDLASFADRFDAVWMLTSALTGERVHGIFRELASQSLARGL